MASAKGTFSEFNASVNKWIHSFFIINYKTMKSENSQHIKLGLFVSLGILLLALGLFFIGDAKQLFTNAFTMSSLFSNVNRLQVGNNVSLLELMWALSKI